MKRLLFLLFTALLAALFVVAVWQDTARDWAAYQHAFIKTLEPSMRKNVSGGIKQVIINDLQRVDRCTTCHLAMEKPQLALGEEPFKTHPGEMLTWHPVEKFGCTVCHGGQGLATDVKAAHGDVAHWEEPLLRGAFVQASCRQCHGDLRTIEAQAPQLVKGRHLFVEKGCYGCHAIKDFGQSVSVDLTEVGSKSHQLMEADFENMDHPHNRIHWMLAKLKNPRHLNPGVGPKQLPPGEEEVYPSPMPVFGFTDEEEAAVATYLLSMMTENLPAKYVRQEMPQPPLTHTSRVAQGRAVYERYGCTACHGIDGVGGRKNWNAGLGEEVPPLLYVRAYYGNDLESLKNVIRNGRQPTPRAEPGRPAPPLYMPPWKERISEDDIDALVAYLLSLGDRMPQPAQPVAPPVDSPLAEPGSESPASAS